MNIINKVTLQMLIKNKVRTIITIIGIILSASMICAVSVLVSSLQNYMIENSIHQYGNWFGNIDIINESSVEKLDKNINFSMLTENQIVGFAKFANNDYRYAPYIYVLGMEDKFKENMSINLLKGRLPENSLEIVLPSHLLHDENKDYNIGDKITLSLGYRKLDDKYIGQNTPYEIKEEFEDRIVKSYTIVGVYEKPKFEFRNCPGYTALTCAEPKKQFNGLYDIYFKTNSANEFEDNFSGNNYRPGNNYCSKLRQNYNVLMYYGMFKYNSISRVLYSVTIIIISLIMFGSIALIYNSFAMSVSERTRQFGLLSSIGATKRQLRKSIIFEAMSLSIIGIPLGILSGIGGIWVTLLCIGDKLGSWFSYELPMKLSVSPVAILVAILITVLTVLISAWIPSIRATKVSAIQSIRLNKDIKINKHKIKTSKYIYKIFKFEGMIANKYYKRSRKKYRATVISLFMSIVLFISASSFCDSLKRSANLVDSTDMYDIMVSFISQVDNKTNILDNIEFQQVYEKLKCEQNINQVAYTVNKDNVGYIPIKYLSDEFRKEFCIDTLIVKVNDELCYKTNIRTTFVDDKTYLKYLKENNLSKKMFYNKDEPVALSYINNKMFDAEKQKFKEYNIINSGVFDINTVTLKEIEGYYYSYDILAPDNSISQIVYRSYNGDSFKKLNYEDAVNKKSVKKIGYVTNNKSIFISGNSEIVSVIYPISYIKKLIPDDNLCKTDVLITSRDHKKSMKNILSIVSNQKLQNMGCSISDITKDTETTRNSLLIINVFSYGFITLITLIAVANVFNTISTNILLRKKDFAMLKSVGLTKKGLNRILRFESFLYGTKALAYGLPASIAVTGLISLAFMDTFDIHFILPYKQIIISIISVFIIVFSTMLYSIHKIKKNNLIDDLRNENI